MTIVLGLKTPQGAILAADTQETYAGSHKVNHPKLVYKQDTNLSGIPIMMAVAGAGVGPWIDKLATNMWDSVQDSTGLDEACSDIESAIKKQYRDFRNLLPFDPTAELIYAVGTTGAVRLFYAYGAIVNEGICKASGSGQAIADFLLRRFTDQTYITNAMALSIYVLMSAKHHADGCGGDTQVAIVHTNGFIAEPTGPQISAVERVLDSASEFADTMLMVAGNTMLDANQLKLTATILIERVGEQLSRLNGVHGMKELMQRIQSPPANT